uniref:Uncharacterized protein n=1 Tax=Anguilla anguilla TaxID=7936 RepID=A0A0E9QL41_ANGAN
MLPNQTRCYLRSFDYYTTLTPLPLALTLMISL